MKTIFELNNISFQYNGCDKNILSDISLNIEEGNFYLICGKSGSGKTTLLQLFKDEIRPHGQISGKINSFDKFMPEDIGYIFQNPDFQIVCHRVIDELSFGLENMQLPLLEMKRRIGEVVNFFNLQTLLLKNIDELSGGQKQLINLASIVAMQPKIMLLDEPTAQLDPIARQEFLTMLKRINEELNITIVMVEHDLEHTVPLCDFVVYLEDGKIKYFGPPQEIPYLTNFEKALPIAAQLYHYEGNKICYNFKNIRMWLDDHKQKIKVNVNKEKEVSKKVILKLNNIHFDYNKAAILTGLNLEIYENEILAIVGGNGSGKTTLLKIMCNLLKYKRGNLQNFEKQKICYLPQDPTTLFIKETVKEELSIKARELLSKLALDHLLEQHPYDLSGGQQQILALVKVVATNPKILLLDEPTKGLDAYYKEKMGKLLEELTSHMTIIVVSHDLEFCAKYANRVGMLFAGKIDAIDKTKLFFKTNLFYTTIMAKLTRNIIDNVMVIEDIEYE